ncbi:MAG: hypothetical protein NPINA01_23590 [Nitrospinaceae bacterium]|nr:MAG: hypothetical protein NPINA01_23590 [Nitrospinaceae bacterium]
MKNLIKVSTVSLVALTLMFGSVGSAMAGSKHPSYGNAYKFSSNQVKNFSRQTNMGIQTTQTPKGGKPGNKPEAKESAWGGFESTVKTVYGVLTRDPWALRDVAVAGAEWIRDDGQIRGHQCDDPSCSYTPPTGGQGYE